MTPRPRPRSVNKGVSGITAEDKAEDEKVGLHKMECVDMKQRVKAKLREFETRLSLAP